MPEFATLRFPGIAGPVVLTPDPALLQGLAACLSGWVPQITRSRRPPADVLAAVAATGDGLYHLRSRFIDRPTGNLPLASAICALLADLSQGWAEAQPDVIGLHGGAVQIGGTLLLVTGPARAGKSTLLTRLALAPGVQLFSDDVLPVTPANEGVALGIAPRLRLPAPASAPALRRLAETAMILSDDRYGYVTVPDQAPHGTIAPIGAVLLLDRQPGTAAQLYRLDPAEALSTLLRQSITGFVSAEAAFARAQALTAGRPCLRLTYSDLEEATALILQNLAPGMALPADLPTAPRLPNEGDPLPDPVAADCVFIRDPMARLRHHGAAAYLWHPDDTMLWELNPIGHAIWQMLELPGSARDLAEALAWNFPDIPVPRLEDDSARLLARLAAAGLVRARH